MAESHHAGLAVAPAVCGSHGRNRKEFFRLCCQWNLEGMVAKRKDGVYRESAGQLGQSDIQSEGRPAGVLSPRALVMRRGDRPWLYDGVWCDATIPTRSPFQVPANMS